MLTCTWRTNDVCRYAFGTNNNYQLGTGDDEQRDTPALLSFGKKFKETWISLDAGTNHSVALTAKGALYVWGDNEEGQLGVQKKTKFEKVSRNIYIQSARRFVTTHERDRVR